MINERQIQEALHRIADTAPDGARVRAGLAHRSRQYRQRRALLLAGGVTAAAAAVAGPAILVLRSRPVTIEAGAPNLGEPIPPPPPAGGNALVPMRWRPTWLPEGYVELSRTVSVAGARPGLQVRSWWLPGSPHGAEDLIHVHAGPPEWFGDQSWRRPATVNGAAGGVAHEPGQVSQVAWQPDRDEMLTVGITALAPDNLDVAQRIAGSVVPDGTSACEIPLELGWLPDGVAGEQTLTIHTDKRGDVQTELQLQAAGGGLSLVRVVLAPTVYHPGGWEPVRVRGLDGVGRTTPAGERTADPGRQLPTTGPAGWVHLELDDRRQLFVSLELSGLPQPPVLSMADVVQVAESLRVGPDPDDGWLGQR